MTNELFNKNVLVEAKHRLIGDYCCDMDMLQSIANKNNYNFEKFTREVFKQLN